MLSLLFGVGSVLCLVLAMAWPVPVVPPLNARYHSWHDDPAWQAFQRQRNRYTIILCAMVFLSVLSLNLAFLFFPGQLFLE